MKNRLVNHYKHRKLGSCKNNGLVHICVSLNELLQHRLKYIIKIFFFLL